LSSGAGTGHSPGRSRRSIARRRRLSVAGLSGLAVWASACAESPSPLHPQGPGAQQQADLWWILFGIAAAIFFFVVFVLLYAAIRKPGIGEREDRYGFGTPLLWIGGIFIPLVALSVSYFLSISGMVAFGDQPPPSSLTIEVIGHQWWWEVRYPAEHIVTANEIHIPVEQRVEVKVTSADVIHDFWVPELQGKIDAIPGQTNSIWIEASRPGTYIGRCLVYCGLQHANMNFLVIADPPAQYAAWVSDQQTTPAPPTDPTLIHGQGVFLSSPCAYCHTIDRTSANGTAGPNLTHLASRQTIGAGTLPNTRGSLGGWIVDPQTIKPGNKMPAESFNADDLQALLAYLESLK
jgi:cytochrome c oxidase subunit II